MTLLLARASIVTMADGAEPADSMLIRDDRIAAVGPAEQVRAAAGRDAQVVPLAGAAFAMHREHDLGSLEPGKLADFVIVDRSPLDVDPERIADIKVLETVVGGQSAFHDGDSPETLG